MDNLEEIAAEITGVIGTVETLSLLVQPKSLPGSSPSQTTLDGVFYHIARTLERISNDINAISAEFNKANI